MFNNSTVSANTRMQSTHKTTHVDNICKKCNSVLHTNIAKFIHLVRKATRFTNFSNLFWYKTLHGSDSSSIHQQEFFTVHTTMVYVIQVSWQFASKIRIPSWSCSQTVRKPVWYIPLLCVQWKTPDDGQRNCPKHVEFYSKNKFEKLVYLGGFIIIILTYITMHGHLNVKIYPAAFIVFERDRVRYEIYKSSVWVRDLKTRTYSVLIQTS